MKRYGKWRVTGDGTKKNGRTYLPCECECGTKRLVYEGSLKRDKSASCGCLKNQKLSQRSKLLVKDIKGERFGSLVVEQRDYKTQKDKGSNSAYWFCKCDCGKTTTIRGSNLLRKNGTQSCGCLSRKLAANRTKQLNRKAKGESSFNGLYYHYQYRSKKRGFDFLISKEQFRRLIQKNCHYCGSPPGNVAKNRFDNGDLIYSGVDRIDATQGYIPGNCVPCCYVCNRAKSDMPQQDFVEWIKRVFKHSET